MFRRAAIRLVRPEPPRRFGAAGQRLEGMFKAHHGVVWRTLRRRGLAPDVAADTVQQVFLVAVERLDDILPGSERAFLLATALRLARSASRKASLLQLEDDMDLHAARGGSVADRRSTIDLLDMVLAKIDADLVDVFVLFEMEGFSSPEIAAMLEVPVGTVASRLRRAREAFRAAANRIELALQRESREGPARVTK